MFFKGYLSKCRNIAVIDMNRYAFLSMIVLALALTFVGAGAQYIYTPSVNPEQLQQADGVADTSTHPEIPNIERLSGVDYDFDDYRPQVDLCKISITPDSAYVLPGGHAKFRSGVSGVEWSAKYGVIEERDGYAYYTAPTALGSSVLIDHVTASKGICSDSAKITIEADAPASIEANMPSRIREGTQASIYALLKDVYGNPVSGKRVKISLSADSGVPDASLDAGNDEGLIVYAVSDSDGKASAMLIAGDTPANYTITVSYTNLTDTAAIAVYADDGEDAGNNNNTNNTSHTPASIDLYTPARISNGTRASIYALLKDANGNPVSDKRVRITLSALSRGGDASLDAGNDEGLIVYAVSDSDGKASAMLIAGNTPANYIITASYGTLTDSAAVEVYAGGSNDTANNTSDTNNTNNTDNSSNNASHTSSGGGSSGSGGSTSSGGVYVVGVNRVNESETPEEVANETVVSPAVATSASPSHIKVTYYKRVYTGGVIKLTLVSDDGSPVVGRGVVVRDPSGTEKRYETSGRGIVEIPADEEGTYTIEIEGTDGVIKVKSIPKPVVKEEEETGKTTETFDIVAAMTGGNPSIFPAVAVVVVLLVLIVGAGVYFLLHKDIGE